jgi:esterase/lipase superfamily enzyme
MKRDRIHIKSAAGASGRFIIISGTLVFIFVVVLALTFAGPWFEERLGSCAKPFEPYRLPHIKEEKSKICNFFYCTDRGVTASEDPLLSYGAAFSDELRLGTFKIYLASRRDLRGNNPGKWSGIEVRHVQELPEETFFSQLRDAVESSPHRSLAVLVFGYGNSFGDALLKGGKLAVSVDIHTPFLVFDWPADQGLGVGGYKRAFSFAKRSGAFLGELLAAIIRSIKPHKLWIGGGSLGTQVICNAFTQMMTHADLADREKEIDHVFLAAPDVGDGEFNEQFKDEIAALARAVTVYVSSDDKALLLSEWIHGKKRLGRSRAEKQEQFQEMVDLLELETKGAEEITVIDVTPVNRATLGHTFYVESSEFFDDIYQRLMNPHPVEARRLYRTNYSDGVAYWIMRDDEE